jgi:uncharacterized SAM-binding protein YcdF (DUF218 family)
MLRGLVGLVALVAWIGVALGLTVTRPPPPEPGRTYDAIVVLGCRVAPGGTPSYALRRRAAEAARLFHAGVARVVVTTGGVGEHGPSEAEVARGVLVELGVPAERVLLEDASTSTEENALFARRNHGGASVVIVTDDYHAFRARRTFERYFDEVAVSTTRTPFARGRALAREVLAISAYTALGRLRLADGDRTFVRPLVEPRPPASPGELGDAGEGSATRSAVAVHPRREPPASPLRGAFVWEGILVSCSSDEARRLFERSHRESRQAGRKDLGEPGPPPRCA